ncbi:MAG: glycosyltransferase family 39 protein [Anaerolineae bacterium]|nr:glycosyltransferase family 39 protein [Anaerolineae bacterium]
MNRQQDRPIFRLMFQIVQRISQRGHWSRWVYAAALIGIVLLAAVLRLHRVEQTPGWFSDEGTHLAIARSLLAGRVQYLALNQSTLLAARLPLFEILLTGSAQVGGLSIGTLRTLTGLLGTVSVALLYRVVRAATGRRIALLAALMLAIDPQAVLYNRLGFSYNLLAPLVLLALWGLVTYRQGGTRSGLALAAGAIGIGCVSDVMMSAFALPLLVLVLRTRPRDAWWSIGLMVLPFAIYAGLMLADAPDAFWFDLSYTLTRLGGKPLSDQLRGLALNYTILLTQDAWFLAGLIGLFLVPVRALRNSALLLLLVPIAVLGRTVALYNLSAYYLIPLLPLLAIGLGTFLDRAFEFVRTTIEASWTTSSAAVRMLLSIGAASLLIVTPLSISLDDTLRKVETVYPTDIDPFLIDPASAQQVADYLNTHSQGDDLIIASPAIAWMFTAHVADFQMSAAAAGQATPHLPANIPADRWAFDPHFDQAQYAVVDPLWRNWGAVHIPAAAAMLAEIEGRWSLVYESGTIQVYRRPR